MRERHEAGQGQAGEVRRSANREAAKAAFGNETGWTVWEARMTERQAQVRGLYLAQAQVLQR